MENEDDLKQIEEQEDINNTNENSFYRKLVKTLKEQKNKKLNNEFNERFKRLNINFILTGQTGCGKSTLINAIFGGVSERNDILRNSNPN